MLTAQSRTPSIRHTRISSVTNYSSNLLYINSMVQETKSILMCANLKLSTVLVLEDLAYRILLVELTLLQMETTDSLKTVSIQAYHINHPFQQLPKILLIT